MTVSVVSPGSDSGAFAEGDAPVAQDLGAWHYAIIKLRADGAFGCPRPRSAAPSGHLSLVDPNAAPDAQRRAWHWSQTLRDAMAETGLAPAATIAPQAVLRVLAGVAGEAPYAGLPLRVEGSRTHRRRAA